MTDEGSAQRAADGYDLCFEPTGFPAPGLASDVFAELPDGTIVRPVQIEGPAGPNGIGPGMRYNHPGFPEGTKSYLWGLEWKLVRRPKRRAIEPRPLEPSAGDLDEAKMRELAARKGYALKKRGEGRATNPLLDYEVVEPDGNSIPVDEGDFSVLWSYLKSIPDKGL
jgi:hypothetical protein